MQLSVADLFASPDHYLFAFEGEQAVFLTMDRAAYARSIFLDARIQPKVPQPFGAPLNALAEWRDAKAPPIARTGWIFHVAQCGSTLLARALDRGADDLVLREPLALRQLGADPARGTARWGSQLRLAATMLGRRYAASAPAIVKANVPVNFIIPDLMALDPEAPAIFLHFPLEDYILAILRAPGHRNWVRNVTGELAPAIETESGADVTRLDDAERAAALWLAQMRIYAAALDSYPNARSLGAEQLFNAPRPVLAAAADLFGVPIPDSDLDAILSGPLFATYSKNPAVAFDNAARVSRRDEAKRALRPDLDRARRWVEAHLSEYPLPARLGKPLAGESPDLL